MSIISVFPGGGKPKLEAGSASPLTYAETYYPSGENEGFSSFKVGAMPSGTLEKPSILLPNANGRVYATAKISAAGYLAHGVEKENYIDLTTQAGTTITPGTEPKTAVAKGRYTLDDVKVAGSASLLPKNIRKGESIFGVAGELELGLDHDIFAVSTSESALPSEDDTFYNSLYIDAFLSPLVSKYPGITPERIEIVQQVDSMEYGSGIMSTEIVGLGGSLTTAGVMIYKDEDGLAFWENVPDFLKCYVGNDYIIIYSTSKKQLKLFNGTYRVALYYKKTS